LLLAERFEKVFLDIELEQVLLDGQVDAPADLAPGLYLPR
jgi:hypothetical protein